MQHMHPHEIHSPNDSPMISQQCPEFQTEQMMPPTTNVISGNASTNKHGADIASPHATDTQEHVQEGWSTHSQEARPQVWQCWQRQQKRCTTKQKKNSRRRSIGVASSCNTTQEID